MDLDGCRRRRALIAFSHPLWMSPMGRLQPFYVTMLADELKAMRQGMGESASGWRSRSIRLCGSVWADLRELPSSLWTRLA
jgi:hypothetical protein